MPAGWPAGRTMSVRSGNSTRLRLGATRLVGLPPCHCCQSLRCWALSRLQCFGRHPHGDDATISFVRDRTLAATVDG